MVGHPPPGPKEPLAHLTTTPHRPTPTPGAGRFAHTARGNGRHFEPTARAIDGLEAALAGLGLLDDALAPDPRKPDIRLYRSTA